MLLTSVVPTHTHTHIHTHLLVGNEYLIWASYLLPLSIFTALSYIIQLMIM